MLLPKDPAMAAVNCTENERRRKEKEDMKEQQWNLRVQERGEDIQDDDEDDEEMEGGEMVVDDVEWDDLVNEDELMGIDSSLQALRPLPYHGEEDAPRSRWRQIAPPRPSLLSRGRA